MCGIAGVFARQNFTNAVQRMTDCLSHRGPDDAGFEVLCTAAGETAGAFGHRRLAIVDLSPTGHQPMLAADGSIALTLNGEIFNYAALRDQLGREGATFRGHSDTEVLMNGWKAHGPAFVERLRGMFAFGIWDSKADRGYLVRDAFGIKPLYVAQAHGAVFFASEIRALLETEIFPRRLSRDAVASFLESGSVAEPLTIAEGIHAVPAGTIVEVIRDGAGFSLGNPEHFIRPFAPEPDDSIDRAGHVRRIRDALRHSVSYHLVSDVPVGVFLSGGIDSSVVAGLASEVSETPLESFTVTFAEKEFSEAEPATAAARRFGTRHHETMLSASDLLESLPDFFDAMDQPSLDGLNTFVVSRAVKSHGLKVVLSGLGGDEMFAGYPSFRRAQLVEPLWRLPDSVRRMGARALGSFSDIRAERIGMMFAQPTASQAGYYASRMLFTPSQVDSLLGRSTPHTRQVPIPDDVAGFGRMSVMQQVSILESSQYMRNTLLRDSDVFSMAHGLELRVPLVDIEVVGAALNAASGLRLRSGSAKPLLVEAVSDLLPPEIVARPKTGFTLPFASWLRNELFDEVGSVLTARPNHILNNSGHPAESVWRGFLTGERGMNWSRPWALYSLLRWAARNRFSWD